MTRLLAILVAGCLPAYAVGDVCEQAWREITRTGPASISDTMTVQADDGWCQVVDADRYFWTLQLDELTFRMDPSGGDRAIDVLLRGLSTPLGTFDGTAALSLQMETGVLLLHGAQFSGADGRGLRGDVQNGLPVFDQSIVADENRLTFDVLVTPAALAETGIDFAQVTRSAVDAALRDVREAHVSGKTRRAFLRFIDAMPNARGTLSITVETQDGARMTDVAAPFIALGRSPNDAEIARAFDVAFDDIRLDIAWKPGRM